MSSHRKEKLLDSISVLGSLESGVNHSRVRDRRKQSNGHSKEQNSAANVPTQIGRKG